MGTAETGFPEYHPECRRSDGKESTGTLAYINNKYRKDSHQYPFRYLIISFEDSGKGSNRRTSECIQPLLRPRKKEPDSGSPSWYHQRHEGDQVKSCRQGHV
ncbi:MAG: hypothetical protein ACLVBC_17735 [Parabacteroides distasonis]